MFFFFRKPKTRPSSKHVPDNTQYPESERITDDEPSTCGKENSDIVSVVTESIIELVSRKYNIAWTKECCYLYYQTP